MNRKMMATFLCVCLCSVCPAYAQDGITGSSDEAVSMSDSVQPYDTEVSQKITLELKGVDILDVLKVLSKKSGLNIVAGKNVRGQVTLFLQDVDVWEALQIVLETSELAYEKKGDIIKVITERDYEAKYGRPYVDNKQTEVITLTHAQALPVSETLNQLKSNVGKIIVQESTNSLIVLDTPEAIAAMKKAVKNIDVPMITKVFSLRYATAEDIEGKLSELMTANVGVIKIDARTNKVIVTDIPSKLEQIGNIIQAFDEKPQQVLVEAKIIEVQLEDEFVLGIDWDLLFERSNLHPIQYNSNTLGGTSVPSSSGPLSSASSSTLPTFTINSSSDAFYGVISALQGMGKTNTLANPRVTVLNNEEASLAVATREPFVSQTVVQGDSTSTTADNVEFVDVGVTLTVKPSISADDYILMEIRPEVSSAGTPLTLYSGTDDEGNALARTVIPVVTSQEVETKVLVKSGMTIILGGLIQDTQQSNYTKVPLLGDIPLLGTMFKGKSADFGKTELVVFITPRILSPDISTDETSRFLTREGGIRPFNATGGDENEYYRSLYKSQPLLTTHDKPFWEKETEENELASIPVRQRVRPMQERRERFDLSGGQPPIMQSRQTSQPVKMPAIEWPTGYSPEISKQSYYQIVKSMLYESISRNPSIRGVHGEIHIKANINRDGVLKHAEVQVPSVTDKSIDRSVAQTVIDTAPFPSFPPELDVMELELDFSLVF